MAKSYFAILGVATDASGKEIQSAYRRLAKKFHPDHYEGGSEAFRQIREAYTVLGDPDRRRAYERSLDPPPRPVPGPETFHRSPEPLVPGPRPIRTGGTFFRRGPVDDVDGAAGPFREALRRGRESGMGRPRAIPVDVRITRHQARYGGVARVLVPVVSTCTFCRGRGWTGFHECERCGATGVAPRKIVIPVSFPPGMRDGDSAGVPLDRYGLGDVQLVLHFRLPGVDSRSFG